MSDQGQLARPFRAWECSFAVVSQGGALGCRRTPRWGWGGWVPQVGCSPPLNANGVVSPSPRLAEERGPPWVLIQTHHPTATRLWLTPSFATSRLPMN